MIPGTALLNAPATNTDIPNTCPLNPHNIALTNPQIIRPPIIETIKEKTVMVKKEELTKALADTFDPKQKAQILKEIIALKDKE